MKTNINEIKILYFDTETTGFVRSELPLEDQPYIIQIGSICEGGEGTGGILDALFSPDGHIPDTTTRIHGITNAMVQNRPKFYESREFGQLLRLMEWADVIVGHNVKFDIDMMEVELQRMTEYLFPEKRAWVVPFIEKIRKKSFCTMKGSIDFVQKPGKFGSYGWPKLDELHFKCFGCYFDNAHNALADIQATKKCFQYLYENWLIEL